MTLLYCFLVGYCGAMLWHRVLELTADHLMDDIRRDIRRLEKIREPRIPTAMEDWDAEFERATRIKVPKPSGDAWLDLVNRVLPYGDKPIKSEQLTGPKQ